MWTTLKNIFITTFVAAFVWVYAESESLREQKVTARVQLSTPSDARLSIGTSADDSRDLTLEVIVQAPSARLERLERRLREPVVLAAGRDAMPLAPGTHTLDFALLLRESSELRDLGVSIRRVEPATAAVLIDELETREVPVRVLLPDDSVQTVPGVSPPTVKVTMPARDMARLTPRDVVTVTIDAETVSRMLPGKPEVVRGLIARPPFAIKDAGKLSLSPTTVDVTVTPRERSGEVVLSPVAVHVQMSPEQMLRWNIEIAPTDRFVSNVRVRGSAKSLEQSQALLREVVAVVALSEDELERGITAKEISFAQVPAGLTVESTTRSVRLSVTRR
jgi:hypothetical protein